MGVDTLGGGVDAVGRALTILACFTRLQPSLTLTAIASRTGLYKSTVLRLIASLERGGFVVRRADKSYVLGPEPMRLGAVYAQSFHLEEHVRPVLRSLLALTGESASLFREDRGQRICLFRENSLHSIRDHVREGDVLPISLGAAARVLVRFRRHVPAEAREPFPLPALSFGERDPETAGAAVPVFDAHGLAGALTLSGPRTRFTRAAVDAMREPLMQAGADLSRTLGGAEAWRRAADE